MVLNQTGGTSLTGVTNESGARSSATYGWSLEESLDVEWSHTIAPDANIVLFEANSNSNANLYAAVATAAKATTYQQYGLPPAGVVSDSWGGSESSSETASDSTFTSVGNTVTFIFSSGDSHPVEYPSASPNVLAVGGTRLNLVTNPFGTSYSSEGWYDTSLSNAGGGGASAYETEPSYQLGVQSSGKRETPDVSMNGDGNSDVLVLDTNYKFSGYYGVYGTSEAAPQWAATLAIADQGLTLAKGTFTTLGNAQDYVYDLPGVTGGASPSSGPAYHDVTGVFTYLSKSGKTTVTTTYTATSGYDTLTGLGSPVPSTFIPDMINYALTNSLSAKNGGGLGGGANIIRLATDTGTPVTDGPTQTFGDYAQGGHLAQAISPIQTAQSAQPGNAAFGQIAAGQASGQTVATQSLSASTAVFGPSPSAGNSLVASIATVGNRFSATSSSPDLAAPNEVAPTTEIEPARVDALAPISVEHSAESITVPEDVIGDFAVGGVSAAGALDPMVELAQNLAEEKAGVAQVSVSTDQMMIAGLAVVVGNFSGAFRARKKWLKRPLLRPRD
jgi:hypothetical protein